MPLQDEIKAALDSFMRSGDESAMQSLIAAHPEIVTPSRGEFPDSHRVVDVYIGNNHYRVGRQISAGEKITLSLVDKVLEEPGVPLWLTGEKLREWAKSEEENPSDGPVDWEIYRK